jgi:NAD-dependent SIR2 family protein deacetylase
VATKTDTKTAKKPRGTTKKRKKNPLVFPPYRLLHKNNNSNDNGNGNEHGNGNTKHDDENDFLESVANLLVGKKNIVVLVGAGISTSVGIPDFRSKDKGLYNTLDAGALGLSCPEDLFCIEFFKSNPLPFYKFAKHLYYPNQKDKATIATARGGKLSNKNGSSNNKKGKGSKEQKPATSTRTSQRIRKRRRNMNGEKGEPALVVDGEKKPTTMPKPEPPARSADATATHQAGTASPSDSHKLLALLEKQKMLLRVYTQNIDGLESIAGVSDAKIVYCHGSLRSMSCTKCSKKNLPLDKAILESIEAGSVPFCKVAVKTKTKTSRKLTKSKAAGAAGLGPTLSPTRISKRTKRPSSAMEGDNGHEHNSGAARNNNGNNNNNYNCYNYRTPDGTVVPCCGGVLKPGITFFGETLDNSVGRKIESDQSKADALIVIGTSLSVAPISRVIEYLPKNIPRILINQTIVHPKSTTRAASITEASINDKNCDENDDRDFRKNYVFDAYLLGFCDDVTRALGKQLGLGCNVEKNAKPITSMEIKTKPKTKQPMKPAQKMAASAAVVVARHASDTGAKLMKGENLNLNSDDEMEDPGWRGITVPRERVLLFPGALPTTVVTLDLANDTNEGEATPSASYQTVAHCDGCSKMIPSGRPIFKCARCFDYDLCQGCYPRISKLHCDGRHPFRKE